MKKLLIPLLVLTIFSACGRDPIIKNETIEIFENVGPNYLPNIHFMQLINGIYTNIDSAVVHPNTISKINIEIYYDNENDFCKISISTKIFQTYYKYNLNQDEFRTEANNPLILLTDTSIDSLNDKVIIQTYLDPATNFDGYFEITIRDILHKEYDLERFAQIPIFVPKN